MAEVLKISAEKSCSSIFKSLGGAIDTAEKSKPRSSL